MIERVQRLFDLKAVPEAIAGHLGADPALAEALQHAPGLRLPGAWDGFELAVRAILGQQISVKAATSLSGRVAQAYGEPLCAETSDLRYLFPTPDRLAEAPLTGLGLMPKRAETIRALARAIVQGELALHTAANLDEAVAQLVAIPGIGAWTAHYIAMRALGEPDAFPAGDLILRRAATLVPEPPLTEVQLRQRAEAWRPWRAYAAMLLWSTYKKPI
jgi:AraC family transcriptional regulator of adaptative response / DNA-3-methyladenine glycosylase II